VIRLPLPHLGQQIVRREAVRINWLAAGRRWRKTTNAMAIAVDCALNGGKVFWGAPVFDQVHIAWEETAKACAEDAKFISSRMTVEFPMSGKIVFRSLDDPYNAKGHTADLAIIDEAGDVNEIAWFEAIRPILISTGGGAWIQGTPLGKNWFYRGCLMAQTLENSKFFNAPTLGCGIYGEQLVRMPHPLENPDIPFEEIEYTFQTVPERTFRQEILAEFLEDAGGVFHGVNDCVDPHLVVDIPYDSSHTYFAGVDFARVSDFSVVCIFDDTGKQVFLDRFTGLSWGSQIERFASALKEYHAATYVDQTSVGDPLLDQLRAQLWEIGADCYVEGVVFSMQSKKGLMDNLAVAIEKKSITLRNDQNQTNELTAYEYDITRFGNVRMNAPKGINDDIVCAMALAIKGWREGSVLPAGNTEPIETDIWNDYRTIRKEIWG